MTQFEYCGACMLEARAVSGHWLHLFCVRLIGRVGYAAHVSPAFPISRIRHKHRHGVVKTIAERVIVKNLPEMVVYILPVILHDCFADFNYGENLGR
jgi:hypothetical protein